MSFVGVGRTQAREWLRDIRRAHPEEFPQGPHVDRAQLRALRVALHPDRVQQRAVARGEVVPPERVAEITEESRKVNAVFTDWGGDVGLGDGDVLQLGEEAPPAAPRSSLPPMAPTRCQVEEWERLPQWMDARRNPRSRFFARPARTGSRVLVPRACVARFSPSAEAAGYRALFAILRPDGGEVAAGGARAPRRLVAEGVSYSKGRVTALPRGVAVVEYAYDNPSWAYSTPDVPPTICLKVRPGGEDYDARGAEAVAAALGADAPPWRALSPSSVLMPRQDGDLSQFEGRLSLGQAVGVVLDVLSQLDRLWAAGLSYIDVSPASVSYEACGEQRSVPMRVQLGDPSGVEALARPADLAPCSAPSPEALLAGGGHGGVYQTQACALWACGVLLLRLLAPPPPSLSSILFVQDPGVGEFGYAAASRAVARHNLGGGECRELRPYFISRLSRALTALEVPRHRWAMVAALFGDLSGPTELTFAEAADVLRSHEREIDEAAGARR